MQGSPTDSELEVLHLLWENGETSVRFINDKLKEKREVGYTTTLKIMQIMYEKGMVERNTESRSHLYKAVVKEENTKGKLLRSFIANTFKGSAQAMVMHALGDHQASQEELEQLKALIGQIENKTI